MVLDNPIWHALNNRDIDKNIGFADFSFFDIEIAPFIGMQTWNKKNQKKLLANISSDRSWFLLIADEVNFIEELEIVFTIPLYQFICPKLGDTPTSKKNIEIVALTEKNIDEMIALTDLTKPGPFRKRTIEFGNYHGIFEDGKLVAMGGERLHVDGFTEVSAICTHPDYRGFGYGAMITHFLSESVIKNGQIPFLHARVDNVNAINVYKKLGFEIRKKVQFYIFKKK